MIKNRLDKLEGKHPTNFITLISKDGQYSDEIFQEHCSANELDPDDTTVTFISECDAEVI